ASATPSRSCEPRLVLKIGLRASGCAPGRVGASAEGARSEPQASGVERESLLGDDGGGADLDEHAGEGEALQAHQRRGVRGEGLAVERLVHALSEGLERRRCRFTRYIVLLTTCSGFAPAEASAVRRLRKACAAWAR